MNFEIKDDDYSKMTIGNSRITEKCALVGYITQCYEVESESQSKGIRFDFKGLDGRTASHTFWVWSGRKKEAVDFQVIDFKRLMAAAGLKRVDAQKDMTVTVYDFDLRADVAKKVTGYPDLVNKKIGIGWDVEDYAKNDGSHGLRPVPKIFFNPETRQTGLEAKMETPAEELDAWLMQADNKPKEHSAPSNSKAPPASAPAKQKQAFQDYNDDIPF